MTDCTQVPTLDEIYQAKKNITDLDTFTNSTADTFVDSDGITKATLTGIIGNIGFTNSGLTFGSGGTLLDRKALVFNPSNDYFYQYIGPLSSVLVPSSPDSNWKQFLGNTLQFLAGLTEPSELDIVYSRKFSTISEMIAYTGHELDNTYRVVSNGFYDAYTVVSYATPISLGSGLYAQLSKNSNTLLDYALPKANIIAGLRGDGTKINLVVISDSFGDGVGASVFQNRFGESLDAIVSNSAAKGYGTGTHARLTDVVNVAGSGITSNGTLTTNGALESQLRLSAGQYIEVTGYEIDFADIWNFGATTTGDLVCTLNGTQYQTLVTTKVSGIKTSFPNGATPRRTLKTDIIRLTASGGQVDITGFNPTRSSAGGIYTIRISHGGWSYKTYDNQLIVDEIAEYTKFNSANSVFILQLGTNSIYNASEAQTPSEMITSMFSFITKLSLAAMTIGFMVCIPPRADETLWSVIEAGYTYDDYRNALLNWGERQGVQIIDLSDIQLVKFGMTTDGLHPDDAPHLLIAEKIAGEIGCYAAPIKDDVYSKPLEYKLPVYNDLWGNFGVGSGVKEVKEGNRKSLSGFAAKNSSTSTTILTIQSAKDFPKNRDPQFICVTDAGTTVVAVDHTTGAVVVVGTTTFAWVCLESVSYEITNA